jgi:YggT family protein
VNTLVGGLDLVTYLLRTALFGVGVIVAALAGLSYAVRTRRLNPFGPVSRFIRGSVDPLFAPVERRVVRAGGRPSTAPWWALAAVVIGGIIIISILGFIRQQIAMAAMATSMGTTGIAALLISWTFGVLRIALLVRVISSWFQMGPYSPWIRWAFVLTDWFLRPLRQIIPPLGMIDISPLVAYFLLSLLQSGIIGMLR